jgi:hypothetical protein
MTPLCVWLPILLVVGLASRLDSIRMTWLIGIGCGVAVIVMVMIPARVRFAERFKLKHPHLNAPYDKLTEDQMRRYLGPNALTDCIVAEDNWVGGNLKLQFPERVVLSSGLWLNHPMKPGEECLLVWDATERASPPVKLLRFVREFAEVDTNSVRFLEAPLKFYQTNRMRLGLAIGKVNANPPLTFTNAPGEQ